MRTAIVIATCLLGAAPAAAQLGVTNPTSPVTITSKGGVARPSTPFGTEPNPFNNPYPTLPNAGTNYAAQFGTPLRQLWVAPQVVTLMVYVPVPAGVPEQWKTQYAEIPGYYVTETTTGLYYPGRWTIDQLNVGVYQWRLLPAEFRIR